MEHKYNKGSEWRKWDLHVHTPESIVHHFKSGEDIDVWEQYIRDIEALSSDIKVLGINDYLFIDGYRKILEYKEKGRMSNIDLFLPVIEFRLAKFSGNRQFKRINYHIIFSNEISADIIQTQFLNGLSNKYKLDPNSNQTTWGGVIDRQSLENLGKAIKSSIPPDKVCEFGSDLIEGFNNLNLEINDIESILENGSQYFNGKYLTAIGKTEWDAFCWDDGSIAEKKTIINNVDIIFTASENVANHQKGKSKLVESRVNSNLLDCSDAHNNINSTDKDRLGNCFTWIKADTTFEGLKQILCEPEDRVRIQDANPALDFEKSPFTEISISDKTQVFNDDNDLFLGATTIPLNNNLISIIGGRGTGKSMLINYLAAGLNKRGDKSIYNISDNVTIKRKTSLSEDEKFFALSDNPNIPFMYIAQSQIKELVTDKSKFTKNIRETIGVIDDYRISETYLSDSEILINEYYRIIKIVNSNNEDIKDKKSRIDSEIKKYEDFITNVTSDQNKEKLNKYTRNIADINTIDDWIDKIFILKSAITDFSIRTNLEIHGFNEIFHKSSIVIPPLSTQETTDYLEKTVLSKLDEAKAKKQSEIDKTKQEFKDYSGDLSSLLSSISSYQSKLSELKSEKETIAKEELLLVEIKANRFKELGLKIEQSIKEYDLQISDNWKKFKEGNPDLSPDKQEMLLSILSGDALNVETNINFETERLYQLLMDKLDGRSYNTDKLRLEILKIGSIDDFYNFIKQDGRNGIFEDKIPTSLRSALIDLFYKKYNSFIKHEIVVTLNGKPINKLSHGQQGTIYLRLQIAANLFSETIIYDQPEDDLDNSFITDELVGIFKEIKKYRQVIIVSHNANLVVNSDSEQIIVAKNEDGILKYDFGSLENPIINESVCKILEGGKMAFEKREQKYGFKK